MTIIKKRASLEMKIVTPTYLSEFNELLRYVFQITNSQLQAIGWKPKEIEKEKRPVLAKAHVLGWFDEGRLVSQVATYPMKVNIHGSIFSMGGVTGVGTYPEYASHGLAKDLIYQSLIDMKDNGQSISYLFPYSIPYYRSKGWEIFCDQLGFKIPDSQLPKITPVPGMVRRVDTEDHDIRVVYDVYSIAHHGAMIRSDLEWQEYWRWEDDDIIAAIYYDENNQAQGYLLYHIANEEFNIKEIVCNTQEANRGLWNYITNHKSMINEVKGHQYLFEPIAYLLEDSEIVETIKPYFMARIVDVKTFLMHFPFKKDHVSISFQITDPLLEFNTGTFNIKTGKQNILSKNQSKHLVKCSIQTLLAMLMNYRRPRYLKKIERLEASPETVELLEQMIPNNEPYFSDYF